VADVGEGRPQREHQRRVRAHDQRIRARPPSVQEPARRGGDREEAVARADVARVGDARRDDARVQPRPQQRRGEQRRADVARGEDADRAERAEPPLDARDHADEEREPDERLRAARQPERAPDEDAHRVAGQVVEVGALRREQTIRRPRAE
jgi:hypothetical protein